MYKYKYFLNNFLTLYAKIVPVGMQCIASPQGFKNDEMSLHSIEV